MTVDFIGDVHGHADALEALLRRLGYSPRGGAWRCPGRHAVFLGDYVDRGPRQLDTVAIVRRMRDAGSATALKGNHEFNAEAYWHPAPSGPGRHLRPREGNNVAQHEAFIDAVGLDSPLHRDLVEFFGTLPMWAEGDTWRAVHACWDPASMRALSPCLDGAARFTPGGFLAANVRGSVAYAAAETLCKGPEADLPDGVSYLDGGGHRRRRSRLRWWHGDSDLFRDNVVEPGLRDADGPLGDLRLPARDRIVPGGTKPVFFGHYWMAGEPRLLSGDRACLDFSVAAGGVLCAYSHDGEPTLEPARLTHVAPAHEPDLAGFHP